MTVGDAPTTWCAPRRCWSTPALSGPSSTPARSGTWGRWKPRAGLDTYGCSGHGWVHARLRGDAGAEVFVVDAHVAPSGPALKDRALRVLAKEARRRHAATAPDAMLVLAGDLNTVRCRVLPRKPEPARCRPRPGHERLLEAGFVDAIRDQHRRGRFGVVGVRRRIDYVYTTERVVKASWDRCYLAYFVTVDPCGERAVFTSPEQLRVCQVRADQAGVPGGLCPRRQYRRYYSDHPILRATVAQPAAGP